MGRDLRSDLRRAWRLSDTGDGLIYRDAHYFTATVEVDPKQMKQWLPPGIKPAGPPRADLFTAHFPDCNYGSVYEEAGLFVHIKTVRGTGIHCPWIIVNDDVALILGREMLGYPKKWADIEWSLDGDHIHATAGRKGTRLISMSGTLGEVITASAPPIIGRPHRNAVSLLGGFGSIRAFTPKERPIEVRRVEDFQLTVTGSERDPIDQMGLGRVIEARLHRVDLPTSRVLFPVRPLSPLFAASRLRPRVL
ncbi:acetoacetate decarboxylase [Pseudonocardiaceae bacterium YIM PH 21723]|nr:acetoacetate decarboxylase [Pseudonocardiaceae bacterium YIM PH 21723]